VGREGKGREGKGRGGEGRGGKGREEEGMRKGRKGGKRASGWAAREKHPCSISSAHTEQSCPDERGKMIFGAVTTAGRIGEAWQDKLWPFTSRQPPLRPAQEMSSDFNVHFALLPICLLAPLGLEIT
jgi:hypothetical protein